MRRTLILPAVVCLAAIPGCAASPEGRLVGIWSIDRSTTTLPNAPFKRAKEKIETVIANFRVKLLADHTLVVSAGQVSEGTWSYKDGHLDWQLKNGILGGLIQDPVVKVTSGETHIDIEGTTLLGPIKIGLRKTG